MLDTETLSRLQFAVNISFHILFPTINIALCWFLFYFKLRHDFSDNPVWMRAYRFWVKIFALTFALGVVSGITMSFQFGTNWPGFMEKVGNIAGPLLGYEVLTAFFMEATFLGIMLFGMGKVPNKVHTASTFIVAIGTMLSAFWILSLNSWMHTPAGHEIRDGVVHARSWWEVIFNPSFPYRFSHMIIASGLTASFFIIGISAYRIRRDDTKAAPWLTLRTGVFVAAILAPLQILLGDLHGLNTFKHQPEKIAAIEAVWETESGAPLLLFAIPDEDERANHLEVGIPKGASFILTHELDGEVPGLNDFEQHPPVKPLFYGFRIMVSLGLLMLAMSWLGSFYLIRWNTMPPVLLRGYEWMTFAGLVATLAGWYVTEIGRQPWLVTDILLTADAVTQVSSNKVLFTLSAYVVTYILLLLAYAHTLKVMARRAISVEEFETQPPQKVESYSDSNQHNGSSV